MQKIYAVNAGSGSEYMVIALFSSMELAIEFMAVVSDIKYNEVEVFELNPNALNMLKQSNFLPT